MTDIPSVAQQPRKTKRRRRGGVKKEGVKMVTISLGTSRNPVPSTPRSDPIDVVQGEKVPPGRDDVIGLWRWYIIRYAWSPLSALFVARLQTCEHLRALCELRLTDNRCQHGVVFALWTFWQPFDRDEEDQRRIGPPLRSSQARRRGRPPAFPPSHHLMAFASLVRQALTSGNQQTAHTWAYTAKILRDFFSDTTSAATRPEMRIRALHARRKFRGESPGEIECIATDFVRDAMAIVEAFARPVTEP